MDFFESTLHLQKPEIVIILAGKKKLYTFMHNLTHTYIYLHLFTASMVSLLASKQLIAQVLGNELVITLSVFSELKID